MTLVADLIRVAESLDDTMRTTKEYQMSKNKDLKVLLHSVPKVKASCWSGTIQHDKTNDICVVGPFELDKASLWLWMVLLVAFSLESNDCWWGFLSESQKYWWWAKKSKMAWLLSRYGSEVKVDAQDTIFSAIKLKAGQITLNLVKMGYLIIPSGWG